MIDEIVGAVVEAFMGEALRTRCGACGAADEELYRCVCRKCGGTFVFCETHLKARMWRKGLIFKKWVWNCPSGCPEQKVD